MHVQTAVTTPCDCSTPAEAAEAIPDASVRARKKTRSAVRPVLAAVLAMLIAACGGGGGSDQSSPPPPPNELSVLPGDPSYLPPYGDAGGDSGDSASGDSGPGLGKFRNALVRVELADGRVAGEAEVDSVRGVVHVKLKSYGGPVRFTVRGKADGSTTYYDEAVGRFVAYPAGKELNAVVAKFDKNVGITILTDGAWRYLATKYGANGWKDAARVTEANNVVRDNFNQFAPPAYPVSDITRLPFLLSDTTPDHSIPANENGRYGVVLSGLGVAAGSFRPNDPAPALALASQMPLDYCDGVLDGACNGVPVVGDPAQAAYTVAELLARLTTGIDIIVTRYLLPPSLLPPSITGQPLDLSILAGLTATFSVTATGTPPLAYQWLRNGVAIAGATNAGYSLVTTLLDNGATFTAVVSNTAGSVTSRAAQLIVTPITVAPTITRQPRSLTVAEGLDATFTVAATGTAQLAYQWSRKGAAIVDAISASYATPINSIGDSSYRRPSRNDSSHDQRRTVKQSVA